MSANLDISIGSGSLRGEVGEPVRAFADRLFRDLGDNFISLSVVGSALTEDFHPGRSDINTVLVVGAVSHPLLKTLAGYGQSLGRQGFRAPWVMTGDYIRRSVDVFGVEFLDFQANHATVFGPDPFTELRIHRDCVRLQCERDLRAAELQLGQGYVRNLGRHKLVQPLLTSCVKHLLPLLRAMLWLTGRDRPRSARATLESAGRHFQLDEKLVGALVTVKYQDESFGPDLTELLFQNIYQAVEHFCRTVDQLGMEQ